MLPVRSSRIIIVWRLTVPDIKWFIWIDGIVKGTCIDYFNLFRKWEHSILATRSNHITNLFPLLQCSVKILRLQYKGTLQMLRWEFKQSARSNKNQELNISNNNNNNSPSGNMPGVNCLEAMQPERIYRYSTFLTLQVNPLLTKLLILDASVAFSQLQNKWMLWWKFRFGTSLHVKKKLSDLKVSNWEQKSAEVVFVFSSQI